MRANKSFCTKNGFGQAWSGANPKVVSYNASSAVKNAVFEKKNIFLGFEKRSLSLARYIDVVQL
jgi:hypothetical protein